MLFADDSGVIACDDNYEKAVSCLQTAVNNIVEWTRKWKIQLNENKSVWVDFALRKHGYVPTIINSKPVPVAQHTRHLGLHLDCELNWQEHVRKKGDHMNLQFQKFQWLIGSHSKLSLANKRLIYKTIFLPAWSYGCEIWGVKKRSNRLVIKRF